MKGHEGWDDYAAYYDWENAQTVGRRDIAFWQRMAAAAERAPARRGRKDWPILELGCGTGRVAIPVAKAGHTVVGIDRSASMLARGSGRIVNIASIGGEISVPHLLPYCVSKFALVALSQGLRSELANRGVYVTTVCPGLMRTGSHWHALFKGQHRKEAAWFSLSASAPLAAKPVRMS